MKKTANANDDTVSCIESLPSAGISIHFKVKIILFLLKGGMTRSRERIGLYREVI